MLVSISAPECLKLDSSTRLQMRLGDKEGDNSHCDPNSDCRGQPEVRPMMMGSDKICLQRLHPLSQQ